MGKTARFIKNKSLLLLAVIGATVVGSLSTAAVLAAIPDSGGTIHGCYRNNAGLLDPKGDLRVINSDSENCTGQETALNWSQNSSSGVVHDNNGQVLGDYQNYKGSFTSSLEVYNHSLNRLILISKAAGGGHQYAYGTAEGVLFQSGDCSGAPYATDGDAGLLVKTKLFQTDTSSYGIVQSNAQAQSITYNSALTYDLFHDTVICNPGSPATDNLYPVSSVLLPFTTPVATPFKF